LDTDAPFVQIDHLVAPLGFVKIAGRHYDRDGLELAQDRPHVTAGDDVDAIIRLVED
jgi:hypothetical protein